MNSSRDSTTRAGILDVITAILFDLAWWGYMTFMWPWIPIVFLWAKLIIAGVLLAGGVFYMARGIARITPGPRIQKLWNGFLISLLIHALLLARFLMFA